MSAMQHIQLHHIFRGAFTMNKEFLPQLIAVELVLPWAGIPAPESGAINAVVLLLTNDGRPVVLGDTGAIR